MAVISGIECDAGQLAQLLALRDRMWAEEEEERVTLNLVREPDGVFTIDDGDSILFEFVPVGWYAGGTWH